MERVDFNKNSTKQFPELKTKVYVINFKQNDKSLLNEYDYNYYDTAREFCIANDNIYFIETHIDKTTGNSGEWAIKEYNLQTKKINIVDEGKFNNFNKYKYTDISFSDGTSLFPRYLDVSKNKLVYNRVKDNKDSLTFEIILYDVVNKSMEIVAKGENYSENYLYNVAISDNRVAYTKYHQINDEINPERATTYKYCDVYLYDINTKKTSQISFEDFIINLDVSGDYIAGIRYTPLSECEDYFKSAELVMYDINKEEWKSFVYNKSNLSVPLFYKNYLVFRDLASYYNLQIYDYINNKFIDFSKEEKLINYEIIDVISDNIMVMNNEEPNTLYRLTLELK